MKTTELLQHSVLLPLQGFGQLEIVELEAVPPALGGFTIKRGAGQYLVCIAAALPDLERARVFLHELSHVLLGHLESNNPVDELEREAEERAASLLDLWKNGGQAEELELLNKYNEKRGQVVPLRV